jgi:hypothetical protein
MNRMHFYSIKYSFSPVQIATYECDSQLKQRGTWVSATYKDIEIKMAILARRNNLGPHIPKSAKVFGYFMVAAGLFFSYVYMFNPALAFPGIEIRTVSEHFGLYSTGVRVIGSVIGILIALLLDSAALLAIMLVTRVFIELGDIIVGLVIRGGAADANTFALTVLAALEVFFLVKLVKGLSKAA